MNEVKLFDITDIAIQELADRYSGLTISGIDDKEGYKAVKAARIVMKGYRVDVDKRRKELNEDALKHQRMINSEAKRITEKLVYIEDSLANEEKKIDSLNAEIKAEEQRKIDEKRQHRIDSMVSVSYRYNGNLFTNINSSEIFSVNMIMDMEDGKFDDLISKSKLEQEEAEKKREDIEKQKAIKTAELKAEHDKLFAEAAEKQAKLEADRLALGLAAEELRKRERWLIEEAERLNAEKQRTAEIKQILSTPEAQKQIASEAIENLVMGGYIAKTYKVTLMGTFTASGLFMGKSDSMALDAAISELVNHDAYESLTLDFGLNSQAYVKLVESEE